MKFVQINLNPKGRKVGDCVIRAIAKATNKSWDETLDELYKIACKKKAMPNSKDVYEAYLKSLGYVKMKQPRHEDGSKYTIQQLLDKRGFQLENMMVISCANHLTCGNQRKHELYDTWDCGKKCVGNYYVKSI